MSARDSRDIASLRVLVHPTATGCSVALVESRWRGSTRTDRILRRDAWDVGERLPLDEPGPLLMALSDHLAALADSFR